MNKGNFNKVDPEPDFKITFEQGPVLFYALHQAIYFHNSELYGINGRIKYDFDGKKLCYIKQKKTKF